MTQGRGNLSYVVNGGFTPHWAVGPAGSAEAGSPAPVTNPTLWIRDNLFNMGLMFLESGVTNAVGNQGNSTTRRHHTLSSVRDDLDHRHAERERQRRLR